MENTLKLNLKRTFIIGFAFFGILLLWQVYDSWCPTFLSEQFTRAFSIEDPKEVQYLVGIIMALDNLAALILLPIFGSLSAFIVSAFYAIQIINGYIEIVSSNNTLTDAHISASAVIVILIFIIYALFNVSNIVLSLLTNVFLIRKEKQDEK